MRSVSAIVEFIAPSPYKVDRERASSIRRQD